MKKTDIIAQIDAEIARLKEVQSLLNGSGTTPTTTPKKKGTMSAEGRARIAAAQKKRWAKIKRTK
jgi:hypothetical protein